MTVSFGGLGATIAQGQEQVCRNPLGADVGLQSNFEHRLPGAAVCLLGRAKPTVVLHDARLAHAGRTEDRATDRFASLLATTMATIQEPDRLAEARVEHEELVDITDAILAGHLPPLPTVGDVLRVDFTGHEMPPEVDGEKRHDKLSDING